MLPTYAFLGLTRKQQLDVVQQAQAALRLLEVLLTDIISWVAERQSALERLASVRTVAPHAKEEGAVDRLDDLAAVLPSFREWRDLRDCESSLEEGLDEVLEEADIRNALSSSIGLLSYVRRRLLAQARAEGRVFDLNLDDLLRGTPEAENACMDHPA